jgi:hypothetical protein
VATNQNSVRGVFRTLLFWSIFLSATYASLRSLQLYWPEMSFEQLRLSVRAADTPFSVFRDKNFAFALSGLIGTVAIGFAIANLASILLIRSALAWNRRIITQSKDEVAFAKNLDKTKGRLGRSRLLGHAFQQFAKTIFIADADPPVSLSTTRPQAFVNPASIREHSVALQLIPFIPGYFVGLGLLLTFIGLIAALGVAAPSVKAGNAEQAKDALNQLLDAATFKFATSIAGLGASLFLSVWFRALTLWVERGIARFCEAIEDRMRFISSQEISREIAQTMRSQLSHLATLNSDSFFERFATVVAPQLRNALIDAIAPLSAKLTQTTQNFTGEDFARRLTTAVENMTQRLDEAATKLSGVVASFEEAGKTARTDLTDAAKGVGGSMTSAITTVVDNIKVAIEGLSNGVTALTAKLENQFQNTEKTAETLRTAAEQATMNSLAKIEDRLQDFNAQASQKLQNLIASLSTQVAGLSAALASASEAIQRHDVNTREAAQNVAATAQAFGVVALDVRNASQPLADSSSKVADGANKIATAAENAVLALTAGQTATQLLACELKEHADRIQSFWSSYETRFATVDQQLAASVKTFGEQLSRQQSLVSDFTVEIDKGFAKAFGNLNGAITNFGEQAGDVRDAVEQFAKAMNGNGHRFQS